MTDRIEPVMPTWAWAQLFEDVRDAEQIGFGRESATHPLTHGDSPDRHAVALALANAALPDSDPRKITREKLAAFESVVGAAALWSREQRVNGQDMAHVERSIEIVATVYHALASYLPPE